MAGSGVFPAELLVVPTNDQDVDTLEQEQNFLDWLSATYQLPGAQAFQSVTINSGDITPNRAFIKVDTQAAAAADDLDHILQTNMEAGRLLFVRCTNASRVVTIRHNQGGAGNILTLDSASLILNNTSKVSVFLRETTTWVEIFRSYANDAAAWRIFFGLGTAAVLNRGTLAAQTPVQVPAVDDIYGLKEIWIWAPAWEPTTTGGCSAVTKVELTAGQPNMLVLDFPDGALTNAFTEIMLPKHWNNGTLTARFAYIVNGAVTTTVNLGIMGVCVGDNEASAVAFGSSQSVTDTYHGTANKLAITDYTPAFTLAGTPATSELTCLQIFRSPPADSTTQDVRLRGVQLRYTANKLNDS